MAKAKFIKDVSKNFTGNAGLYKLDIPLDGTKYVVVSATIAMFSGPETYIFPANSKGVVTDWGELTGSCRGTLDHKKALRSAGYEVE